MTGSLPRDGQAGMTGQLKLPDGSNSAPSISFTNEPTTGFARSATGTISVDILGVQIATITSAGWVGSVTGAAPIGTVVDFAGTGPPAQWYLCFGQAVSRTTYSALFAVISTIYGAGDGVTTFNLPDYRGCASAGVDNMGGTPANRITSTFLGNNPDASGAIGGSQSSTLGTSNLPAYTPSGSIANGAITSTAAGQQAVVAGGGSQLLEGSGLPFNVNTISIVSSQAGSSFTGNAQGGSSIAFTNIQPTIMMNKMIFAGA